MHSIELIRKFPITPTDPILFVVYNEDHIDTAAFNIVQAHGKSYLDHHVTIVPFDMPLERSDVNYQVYIDPMVFIYKNSWNN